MRVSEIRVKRIRVNQGLGVTMYYSFLKLQAQFFTWFTCFNSSTVL